MTTWGQVECEAPQLASAARERFDATRHKTMATLRADGSPLDAETVKLSIERTKAMSRGGAFFLQALKEVQVVDRMTVRLVATQPSVSLLSGLPKVFITGKAHLADADPHLFPHAGLFNAAGQARPALEALRRLREEHLA